jgi:hypothetical protein
MSPPLLSCPLRAYLLLSNYWKQTTLDFCEEIAGWSIVLHCGFRVGAAFVKTLAGAATKSALVTQAENVLCFLQSYRDPARSRLGANTALASDEAIMNSSRLRQVLPGRVPVQRRRGSQRADRGLPLPRDVYSTGNVRPRGPALMPPRADAVQQLWYLATFLVAGQLYDTLYVWTRANSLASLRSPRLLQRGHEWPRCDRHVLEDVDPYKTVTTAARHTRTFCHHQRTVHTYRRQP